MAEFTGLKTSPMQLEPIIRKEVPWKAVKMRKMKKDARLGARAEPIEKARKRAPLMMRA